MHHHRRRSGHASGNTSMTDVRKAVTATDPSAKKYSSRPPLTTRKSNSGSVPKLGRNPRDREKELEDERWWDEERQSFPEYWYVILFFLVGLVCFTASTAPCPSPPSFLPCPPFPPLSPVPSKTKPAASTLPHCHLICRRSVLPYITPASEGLVAGGRGDRKRRGGGVGKGVTSGQGSTRQHRFLHMTPLLLLTFGETQTDQILCLQHDLRQAIRPLRRSIAVLLRGVSFETQNPFLWSLRGLLTGSTPQVPHA